MIETTVRYTNAVLGELEKQGKLDKKALAVGVEINQSWYEYLEELETTATPTPCGVTVEVDGKTIHFPNVDAFSNWLAEQL